MQNISSLNKRKIDDIQVIMEDKLEFYIKDKRCLIGLCLCRIPDTCEVDSINIDFLSTDEKRQLTEKKRKQNKINFLLGRYAAKQAVTEILDGLTPGEIQIYNNILGQPYLTEVPGSDLEVTISHSGEYGLAVVYPKYLCMGVDIEKITPNRNKVLEYFITDNEKKLIGIDNEKLTMLWSVKEAASKCIMTGITLPAEMFSLKTLLEQGNGIRGHFRHLVQYQYVCIPYENYAIGFVYPAEAKSAYGFDKVIRQKLNV